MYRKVNFSETDGIVKHSSSIFLLREVGILLISEFGRRYKNEDSI